MIPSEKKYDAVSPVVGVMLMLTLVIILAAVLSAFSGGIAGNSNSGSLIEITAETKIINTGDDPSRFEINIISVNSPVSTKDLKLKTSWKTYEGGVPVSVDTYSIPGDDNFDTGVKSGVAPIGTGAGFSDPWDGSYEEIKDDMSFGNYALLAGTSMVAYPSGYGEVGYPDDSKTDCMQAVLGEDWYDLKSGDVVSVTLIHVPSGRIIYDDDVYVNSE